MLYTVHVYSIKERRKKTVSLTFCYNTYQIKISNKNTTTLQTPSKRSLFGKWTPQDDFILCHNVLGNEETCWYSSG